MRVGRSILVALLMMILLLSVGCGSSKNSSEEDETRVLRQVELDDEKIIPDYMKVMVHAPVRFIVKNKGDHTHEFRILMDPPIYVEVAPKSKAWLDAVFEEPGKYEFVDTVSENENLDLRGELEVEANE